MQILYGFEFKQIDRHYEVFEILKDYVRFPDRNA